ncbi:hypothetical protein PAMP_020098 [Pampus punctatissimus]
MAASLSFAAWPNSIYGSALEALLSPNPASVPSRCMSVPFTPIWLRSKLVAVATTSQRQ